MKKIILFLIILTATFSAGAQKVELSSVSLSSGNGPLSSGLFLETNFNRGNDVINLSLGERDLYVFYLKSALKKKLLIGPCLEYYHNIPTVSGMAIFSPIKHWSTFTWAGYSAGILI